MYGVPGFSTFIIFLKNKYRYFHYLYFLKGWGTSDNTAQAAHIAQRKGAAMSPFYCYCCCMLQPGRISKPLTYFPCRSRVRPKPSRSNLSTKDFCLTF